MANPLAFSTLGCPGWDLARIISSAKEYGYDAVELRGYLETVDLMQAEPFPPGRRAEAKQRFADAGIAVCCVSSSGIVAQGNVDHVRGHAELARALDCPVVRVFGGALSAEIPRNEAMARAAEGLRAFGDAAQENGVKIVLETHDSFSTGRAVAELIAAADHPAVRSLWDLHNPYRLGEPIEETHRWLAPTMAHTHVKDSRPDGKYSLLGEGDIPILAMLDLILDGGYQGAISLEWEKRWHPEIDEPEVVFPQYARALREYVDNRQPD